MAGLFLQNTTTRTHTMTDKLEQEPVCYMQENQPYVYVSETKNEGSGYTIPLYTSPPNAKAIEAAALMKAVRALEANEQFYARDTIQSLIDAAPNREEE